MRIKDIVATINIELAGEQLTFNQLKPFLDHTIDDINSQLNANYPVFSGFGYDIDYNFFPDKFIRMVVMPGAAWYYYVADEEGSPSAQQYSQDYARGMFTMQRDMLYNIPVEYQADSYQGTVQFEFEAQKGIEIPYGIGED